MLSKPLRAVLSIHKVAHMSSIKPFITYGVLLCSVLVVSQRSVAQSVSINTTGNAPDPSAMLHVEATDKGLIVPRVQLDDSTTAAPVTAPAEGLVIYNETGTEPKGLYYWDSGLSSWVMVGDGAPDTYWDRDAANGWLFPSTISDNVGIGDADPEGKLDVHGRTYIGGDGDVMNDNAPGLDLTIDDDVSGSNTGFEVPGPDTLAFYAGGIEQARIFPDGVMSVNAVPGAGTHTFYSEADAGGGDHAITGVVTGSGVGVFGQSLMGTGSAVVGLAANSSAYGVEAVNLADNGGGGYAFGDDFGVLSFGDSIPGGIGLWGAGNGKGATAPRSGAGVAGVGETYGVYGLGDSVPGGIGVIGVGNAISSWTIPNNGTGVLGHAKDLGVVGSADSVPGGIGVRGLGNGLTTGISPPEGAGVAGNGNTYGVSGFAENTIDGIGILGVGNGITSIPVIPDGGGILGVGDSSGVVGVSVNSTDGSAGGRFGAGGAITHRVATYTGGTLYKIRGPGSASTIVKDENGERVTLFAPEAPEPLFEDYGRDELENGKARVELDPTWAENIQVDEEHPLRVFVQVEGNCKGVYVTNKSEDGFTVKELENGRSNVPFTYKVVANRKDVRRKVDGEMRTIHYEDLRFPSASGPTKLKEKEMKEREWKEGGGLKKKEKPSGASKKKHIERAKEE